MDRESTQGRDASVVRARAPLNVTGLKRDPPQLAQGSNMDSLLTAVLQELPPASAQLDSAQERSGQFKIELINDGEEGAGAASEDMTQDGQDGHDDKAPRKRGGVRPTRR